MNVITSTTVRRVTGPPAALAFVCVFHAIAPLIWVGSNLSYEWDETVYISQVSLHAQAACSRRRAPAG